MQALLKDMARLAAEKPSTEARYEPSAAPATTDATPEKDAAKAATDAANAEA
jgi:hypothetical protein